MANIIKKSNNFKVYFPQVPLRIKHNGNFMASKGLVIFKTPVDQNKIQIKNYLEDIERINS